MKSSPESPGTRLVVLGTPAFAPAELLRAAALRRGVEPPEPVQAGTWEVLLAQVAVASTPVELACMVSRAPYAGVAELMLESADGVIVLFDVSPDCIVESRRFIDGLRPRLEKTGLPFAVQYHRIERELRFDEARIDQWLGLAGSAVPRGSTRSDAPDEALEELVTGLIATPSGA